MTKTKKSLIEALQSGFQEMSTVQIMLHEAVAQRAGLNATEHKVMALLCRCGPMTAGSLAQATGLTTGAVTQIVDRIEAKRHARRIPNPADGRSVYISATNPQRYLKLIGESLQPLRKAMEELALRFTTADLDLVLKFLLESLVVSRTMTRVIQSAVSSLSMQ